MLVNPRFQTEAEQLRDRIAQLERRLETISEYASELAGRLDGRLPAPDGLYTQLGKIASEGYGAAAQHPNIPMEQRCELGWNGAANAVADALFRGIGGESIGDLLSAYQKGLAWPAAHPGEETIVAPSWDAPVPPIARLIFWRGVADASE